ncbi:putative ubiquitin domain protein [Talaromyces proteolyticus]|uniref:Ubiquitin domain protein n=1 Tax=Talaromyces proteolyticus TaxID=1131652 RepID=A0AAD4Q0K5_9EURO|nr:putative ubiquitin domain protein [Talaromyces proteolyticus]KAH8697351.1 putative ubiquitin domain protein [Talaromyces proteolyticus]
MGCCFSRSNNDEGSSHVTVTQESYADHARHSEHSANNQNPNEAPRRQSQSRRVRNHQGPPLPLDQHYNQPIRLHVWRSKRRTWTPAQLAKEREEFWDTRVTGRSEIWDALRAAISLLCGGETDTAQGIIDAAGITVPTGDFCEGCYDENGVLYRLPQCIVSDPENMVDDSFLRAQDDEPGDDVDDDAISDPKIIPEESDDELIPDDLERRREEKGKMSERDMIKVRARLSDRGGPDVTVSISKTQTVGMLARRIQSEASVPSFQRVRIAYLGRMLKEHEPLLDQGWNQSNIINALVVSRSSL